MAQDTTPETDKRTDAEKRRAAYTAGERRLREAHREEFLGLVKQEAERLGVEYVPRKTEEEKAEEALNALLSAHPGLAAKVAGQQQQPPTAAV